MQKHNTIQSPIIALVTLPGKANDLAEYVRQAKFWVNVAQYPIVPKALERVRICIHAHNSVEEINGLTTKILEWAKSQHQHQPPLSLSWSQPRSKQAVTLVGAGTQGTRLAYMVCLFPHWCFFNSNWYGFLCSGQSLEQPSIYSMRYRANQKKRSMMSSSFDLKICHRRSGELYWLAPLTWLRRL